MTDLVRFGLIVTEPDGRATLANRSWLELSRQGQDAWRGDGWFSVLPEEHRARAKRDLVADARARRTHDVDWTVRDPVDGRPRVLKIEATPAIAGGEVTRIVVTATDVTAQRERVRDLVEKATRDPVTGLYNRHQFLEFVRHALDRQRRDPSHRSAVFVIDVHDLKATNDIRGHVAGDELLRDAAAGVLSAVRPSDVVARYSGDGFAVLGDPLGDSEEATRIAERIRANVATSGRGVRVGVGFVIADDADVDPPELVATANRSMLDSAATGEPRLRSVDGGSVPTRARATVAQPVDFVAVAAHEIKTPLTSIVGYASALRTHRDRMSEEAQDAAFIALDRQTTRLASMVDQLLDLGRLRHPSNRAVRLVDLEDVVTDALEIAPPHDPASVIVLIGSDASALRVLADPTSLSRAVVNLLTNAYAHGGPHVTIEVSRRARHIDLVVEDDGDGVPDDVVPVLFEPFARGRGHGESRPAGSGLGLAIARDVVVAIDGTLTHERVEPHGTRMRLSLPAVAALDRTGSEGRS